MRRPDRGPEPSLQRRLSSRCTWREARAAERTVTSPACQLSARGPPKTPARSLPTQYDLPHFGAPFGRGPGPHPASAVRHPLQHATSTAFSAGASEGALVAPCPPPPLPQVRRLPPAGKDTARTRRESAACLKSFVHAVRFPDLQPHLVAEPESVQHAAPAAAAPPPPPPRDATPSAPRQPLFGDALLESTRPQLRTVRGPPAACRSCQRRAGAQVAPSSCPSLEPLAGSAAAAGRPACCTVLPAQHA